MNNYIALFVVSTENGNLKVVYLFEKTLVLSIISSKCKNKDKKIFKAEESIETLNIIGLLQSRYLIWFVQL